jgi:hypothetical protein
MHQPALSAVLYPSTATADLMGAQFDNRPGGAAILWLSALYLASVALLFAKEFNFYEQSIASTTRMAAFRSAAKGGYASLMAQRASTLKRKSARTYSVPPFGQGAVAVFWGHLSAAARRPWVNFIMPTAGGLAEGIFGGLSARTSPTIAISAMAGLALYVSIGFLGAAKTASEAAIRRRELLAPLPIPGWQMVVANLGIPISAAACFGLGAAIGYTAMGGPHWPLLVLGLVVLYPLRLSDRMAIQYLIVLGFPDLADKIQQLVGQSVTYLAFIPCILLEVIACIPAILFRSPLIALCSLIAVQLPLLFFSLWVGGRASERAIATGEPVRLSKLFAS